MNIHLDVIIRCNAKFLMMIQLRQIYEFNYFEKKVTKNSINSHFDDLEIVYIYKSEFTLIVKRNDQITE